MYLSLIYLILATVSAGAMAFFVGKGQTFLVILLNLNVMLFSFGLFVSQSNFNEIYENKYEIVKCEKYSVIFYKFGECE